MSLEERIDELANQVGLDIKSIADQIPDTTASPVATVADAQGSTLGLEQGLLASSGQPALTVLAVGFTNTGRVQGCSLGDGNVIEVYATGADFTAGNVLYREFMSLGEPICFTGLSNGAIITSTQGFYGFSEQVEGVDESNMPLLSYGLSFTFTLMLAFRNCQTYDPTGTSTNQGWIHVVNGPIASTLKFMDGNGVTVQGQEDIELIPWAYHRLYTEGNKEYVIESTNPVMACHNANMDSNPTGRFYDSRLIMPLSNDLISWPRSGDASAPFADTQFNYFVRDGAKGTFVVNPGSPQTIDSITGATDADYEPPGATRTLIDGLGTWYSGADSAGLEATPAMPVNAMSQVVAQPLFIADTGDGGNSSVAIASPYTGTAKVYAWNDTTKTTDLIYTVPLTRTNVTIIDKEDQKHPASGGVMNDSVDGVVTLVGQLNAGVIIADVPITVVVQNGTLSLQPTIRSQNGTTTTSIISDDDETLSLGWTPSVIKAEITKGLDEIFYRRELAAGGVPSWIEA